MKKCTNKIGFDVKLDTKKYNDEMDMGWPTKESIGNCKGRIHLLLEELI